MSGYIWGDAEVSYPDWKGTAQLDERITVPTIHEILGDRLKDWFVIGIDIGGGELDHDIKLIAVPKDALPDGGDVLPRYAEQCGGEIHATSFVMHDMDPYQFLKAIAHMFELRMRVSGCRDLPIRIVSMGDVPEQPRV